MPKQQPTEPTPPPKKQRPRKVFTTKRTKPLSKHQEENPYENPCDALDLAKLAKEAKALRRKYPKVYVLKMIPRKEGKEYVRSYLSDSRAANLESMVCSNENWNCNIIPVSSCEISDEEMVKVDHRKRIFE